MNAAANEIPRQIADNGPPLDQLGPDNGDFLRERASVHERMGQYDAALAALEEYRERFPDDNRGFLSLAAHYKIQGELTLEREYVERAFLMAPTSLSIIRQMAELDLRVGAFDEAKAGYDRALSASVTLQERGAGGSPS